MRKHTFNIENSCSNVVIFNDRGDSRAVLVTGDQEEFIGTFYRSADGYKKYCWKNRTNPYQGVVGSTIKDLGSWIASWGHDSIKHESMMRRGLI